MGADFFPEEGKNASKIVIPPKMALGEGIFFAPSKGGVEGRKRGGGDKPHFCKKKTRELEFYENMRRKSKVFFCNMSHKKLWLFSVCVFWRSHHD